MNQPAPPRLFSYMDYREFCRDWWTWRQRVAPDTTHATFASATGLARSAFHNVLTGSRIPRPATLDALARGMELTPTERNYLGLLVDLERASGRSARLEVVARIIEHHRFGLRVRLEDLPLSFEAYGARWYTPAILELARLPGFRPDPDWVAATVFPPISVDEAREALELLKDLGLLAEADGRMRPSARRVDSSPESTARASARYHMEAIPELLRRLAEVPHQDRHVAAAIVLLPTAQVPEVKQRLDAVVRQISDLADDETEGASPRRAYIVAMHLLPASLPVAEGAPPTAGTPSATTDPR